MARSQKWPSAIAAAAAALLLGTTALTAADVSAQWDVITPQAASPSEYRCIHDELGTTVKLELGNGIVRVFERSGTGGTPRYVDPWDDDFVMYLPLRINISTHELDSFDRHCTATGDMRPDFRGNSNPCTQADILTTQKRRIFVDELLPKVRELHEERLDVWRMRYSYDVSGISTTGYCGSFTVPQEHLVNGISDTDFMLYVASGPSEVPAFGGPCGFLASGRPVVGVLHWAARFISSDATWEGVLTHEMLHALGFSASVFEYKGIYRNNATIRGKSSIPALHSPKVLDAAKAHFGCQRMTFVELEDEGRSGVVGSHWKMRNMKDELMTPTGHLAYYTAITMATLEDLGFFKPNYHKAEVMPWGRGVGCNFLDEPCVVKEAPLYSSMFCTEPSRYSVCTADRRNVGYCATKLYDENLPSVFQYFFDKKQGGIDGIVMDYCPVISPIASSDCTNTDDTGIPGSVTGSDARCFDIVPLKLDVGTTTAQIGGVCAKVKCETCKYSVQVKGASNYTECKPGAMLFLHELSTAFSQGTLLCPAFSEVCTDTVNPYAVEGPYTPFCEVYIEEETTTTLPPTLPPTTTLAPSLSNGMVSTFSALLVATLTLMYWGLGIDQ